MAKSGLSDFRRGLKNLDRAVKAQAREAIDMASNALADQVRKNAPVQTGALKESVVVKPVCSRRGRLSQRVTVGGGHDHPIAGQVEYGTRDTPADPFFRRAAGSKEAEMVAIIEGGIRGD